MIWSNNDLELKKFTRVNICQKKRWLMASFVVGDKLIHCQDDIEEVKLWQRFRLGLFWKKNQQQTSSSAFFLTAAPLITEMIVIKKNWKEGET